MITTQTELRNAFWDSSPDHLGGRERVRRWRQTHAYPCETRQAWCDFVDSMARDGQISESLADRATL